MKHWFLVVVFLCVCFIMYVMGYVSGLAVGTGQLRTEAANNLSQRIETLSYLRLGEQDQAIQLLEKQVDAEISILPQGQDYESLPEDVEHSLGKAKLYRMAYPSDSPEAQAVLAGLPTPPPYEPYCDQTLRRALVKSGQPVDIEGLEQTPDESVGPSPSP